MILLFRSLKYILSPIFTFYYVLTFILHFIVCLYPNFVNALEHVFNLYTALNMVHNNNIIIIISSI